MKIYRVTSPDFVSQVVCKYGFVIGRETSHHLRYMHKWTERRFLNYCNDQRWTVETIPDESER